MSMLFLILALAFSAILLLQLMMLLQSVCSLIPFLSLLYLSISVTMPFFMALASLITKLVILPLMIFLMLLLVVLLLLFHVKHLLRRCLNLRNKFAGVSDPNSFISCSGERIHTLYDSRFDGSRVVLEESGSFDIQERINSFAPYTDISYMLNRLKVGDTSVLSSRPPMYGDFSGLPDNPTDAINMYHGAERAFSQLPTEEKLAYNNDFRVWLSALMAGNSSSERSVPNSEPVVDDKKVEESVNES